MNMKYIILVDVYIYKVCTVTNMVHILFAMVYPSMSVSNGINAYLNE